MSRSHSAGRGTAPPRAWTNFIASMAGEFDERELGKLSLQTLRLLVKHVGVENPIDVAHIELEWRRCSKSNGRSSHADPMGSMDEGHTVDMPNQKPHPSSPQQHRTFVQRSMSPRTQRQAVDRLAPPPRRRRPTTSKPDGFSYGNGNVRSSSKPRAPEEVSVPDDLAQLFKSFAGFGTGTPDDLDNFRFSKMCKDCGLLDRNFPSRDADILWEKTKKRGERKIPYHVFRLRIVPEIAARRHMSISDLVTKMNIVGGPEIHGTFAADVRLHDDQAGYTGVARNGGPSTLDGSSLDLFEITDRSKADVRGIPLGIARTRSMNRRSSSRR